MEQRITCRTSLLVIVACGLFLVHPALAGDYVFMRIADTAGNFSSINPWSVTDGGVVSFDVGFDSGNEGVFLGDAEGVTKIVATGDTLNGFNFQFVSNGVVNEHGQVVFGAKRNQDDKVQGTFLYDHGVVTKLDTTTARQSPGWHWINNLGEVAAESSANSYTDLYLFRENEAVAKLTGSSINGGTGSPIINDAGQMVITSFTGQSHEPYRLWSWDGETATKIFATDFFGPYAGISPADLNADGAILFVARHKDLAGGATLFRYSNGTLHALIDSDDSPYYTMHSASISDDGGIAFWALLDDDTAGVFTGPDPELDAVLRDGDILDGQTVAKVNPTARSMRNNRGQIALSVNFADGTQALYLASPVPEPSAAALASSGSLLLLVAALGYARRRAGRFVPSKRP